MSFLGILAGLVLGAIIIVLLVGIPIALIWSIMEWAYHLESSRPWLKFKDFIMLYEADPDKWNLADSVPQCKKNESPHWGWSYIYFKFNYIDFYRYKFWKWNTKRQKNKEYAREQYEAMLKEIDVDFGIPYKEKKAAAIKDLCNYVSEQVRKKEK